MINRNTIDLKNFHKLWGSMMLKTQENTMSTLPYPMMPTLFVYSLEHTDGFLAYIFNKSHR